MQRLKNPAAKTIYAGSQGGLSAALFQPLWVCSGLSLAAK